MSDIAELKAGRELDARVAEKIIGLDVLPNPQWCYFCEGSEFVAPDQNDTDDVSYYLRPVYRASPHNPNFLLPVPEYSADIAAAWQVVEHLRAGGWEMTLSCNNFKTDMWDCRLFHISPDYPYLTTAKAIGFGPDAPTTICRAALAAKGEHGD